MCHSFLKINKKTVTLTLFFLILIITGCSNKPANTNRLAEKGIIDLSDWAFKEKGSVLLSGEWEFYWGRLLTPLDFKSEKPPEKTGFINLPGLWDKTEINGTVLSSTGHATYRLTTRINPQTPGLSLYISNPLSVFKLWVNGKLVAKSGDPGISKASESPKAHMVMVHLQETKAVRDIVLQISNYHNIQGGMLSPIILGKNKQIHRLINRKVLTTAFLSGAIFVLSLYHLGLYCIRRSDYANLYFGLYCLMEAVSTAFGDRGFCLVAQFVPGLQWQTSIDLSLLPHGLTIPLLVMFYHSLFPWPSGNYFERFYQIPGVLFILYILLTPTNAFDPVMTVYRILSVTIIPYLFFRFIVDLKKGADGIKFLIPGYAIVCIAALNDFLVDLEIINTTLVGQYATIVLIISYSFLISIRLSKAYEAVKNLSIELEEKNSSLIKLNTTLRENLTLKKELALRQETEKEIRLIHHRLADTLGFSNDAILAVNECSEISFCNPSFEAFSGYQVRELLGQPFHLLVPEKDHDMIRKKWNNITKKNGNPLNTFVNKPVSFITKKQKHIKKDVMITALDMDEGPLLILIIPNRAKTSKQPPLMTTSAELIRELNKNRERLVSLEAFLSSLPARRLDNHPEVKTMLYKMDKHLSTMTGILDQSNPVDKRRLGVKVLNLAVDYWVFSTKNPKALLAEQSKLWSVYFEKDGFARTQTLDKYLNKATLPARPRWKTIINTPDFVLEECKEPSHLKEELVESLEILRTMI